MHPPLRVRRAALQAHFFKVVIIFERREHVQARRCAGSPFSLTTRATTCATHWRVRCLGLPRSPWELINLNPMVPMRPASTRTTIGPRSTLFHAFQACYSGADFASCEWSPRVARIHLSVVLSDQSPICESPAMDKILA